MCHGEQVRREFAGECWTHQNVASADQDQAKVASRFGLKLAMGRHGDGLGRKVMHFGDNSGYQAINLAYLWGARRILLLGYDMQLTGGRRHWFGDHPAPLNSGSDYRHWVAKFRRLAADLASEGVQVINCSRETALDCFPRMEIDRAL